MLCRIDRRIKTSKTEGQETEMRSEPFTAEQFREKSCKSQSRACHRRPKPRNNVLRLLSILFDFYFEHASRPFCFNFHYYDLNVFKYFCFKAKIVLFSRNDNGWMLEDFRRTYEDNNSHKLQ